MESHFNKLTPAEAERLAMLAEECAEVIHVVGKILRHGYESVYNGLDNRTRLRDEVLDLCVVMNILIEKDFPDYLDPTDADVDAAFARKQKYSHHQ